MRRKLMLLMTFLVLSIGMAMAQEKVTGVVLSAEDNEPVVGASVLVKGLNAGTVTDVDGKFTLPALPSSAKFITISYIGMKSQQVAVKSNMTIILQSDAKSL